MISLAPRGDRRILRTLWLAAPALVWILISAGTGSLSAQVVFPAPLGPMPFPPENPPTPQKEMLGKFLFWEEHLSSDDSTACASCHIPEFGGGDPRAFDNLALNPGADGLFGTEDDVRGSVGVPRQECDGTPILNPSFQFDRQVTGRKAPTMIGAGYAPEIFWDGRATSEFRDPITDGVVIAAGGALESQAVGPPLSDVEMACVTRDWPQITAKLATVTPLSRATDIPQPMLNTLALFPGGGYPELFNWAFGTTEITPVRIAFAIAAYERTLVPDHTPFDLYVAGTLGALTPDQEQGLLLFLDNCTPCHDTIELSDNDFHNIGVRPSSEDIGREAISGDPLDTGKFKTPGLRNVALRAPFFHNGGKATLDDVLAFYNGGGDFADNLDIEIVELMLGNGELALIKEFLEVGLTDPRVEFAQPPFDHPKLQVFFKRGDSNFDDGVDIADAIHLLSYIFPVGAPFLLTCEDASDANDDGGIDIGDPITVLDRLFVGAPPLAAPSDLSHGPDPTGDFLGCLD